MLGDHHAQKSESQTLTKVAVDLGKAESCAGLCKNRQRVNMDQVAMAYAQCVPHQLARTIERTRIDASYTYLPYNRESLAKVITSLAKRNIPRHDSAILQSIVAKSTGDQRRSFITRHRQAWQTQQRQTSKARTRAKRVANAGTPNEHANAWQQNAMSVQLSAARHTTDAVWCMYVSSVLRDGCFSLFSSAGPLHAHTTTPSSRHHDGHRDNASCSLRTCSDVGVSSPKERLEMLELAPVNGRR